jgi:hypothetical protein
MAAGRFDPSQDSGGYPTPVPEIGTLSVWVPNLSVHFSL